MKLNFSLFIENRIKNIKAADCFAFAMAVGLGPWLVPLGPAIVFGYAFYESVPVGMSADLRLAASVSVAIGLIVAGAVSSHIAIASPNIKPWSLVAGYIGLEIAGLWLMTVAFDIKIVGTVASLLTLIVYLSRSSAKEIDAGKTEAKAEKQIRLDYQIEQAKLDAEHRRAMAAKEAELKHAEKLARIEAKKEKDIVSVSVKQSVNSGVKQDVNSFTLDSLKEALQSDGRPNMTQLAKDLGISRPTLYKKIDGLIDSGEVIKNGNGYELASPLP